MVLFVSQDALPNDALKLSIALADNHSTLALSDMPEPRFWNLKKGLIFETEDKKLIFEANSIARFLTNSVSETLTPKVWINLNLLELEEEIMSRDDGQSAFNQILNFIEKKLKTSSIIISDNAETLSEISLWSYLYCHFNLYHKDSLSKVQSTHSNAVKWYNSCLQKPKFQSGVKFFESTFLPKLKIVVKEPKLEPFPALLKMTEGVKYNSKFEKEVLPVPGERNILITSALPYVNNVPHLGNIIGCVLSADVYARYARLKGYNTVYICGTDEYGTATETKALSEGLTCQEICDKYHVLHRDIYKWFEISFDHFGRTTTKEQTEIAQDIFLKLNKNKFLTKGSMIQLLCENCNRFLADRFVEGTCPKCGYDDARGDQCDKCGNLINAEELINPRCKVCSNRPVLRNSDHMFLDLSVLQPECENFVENSYSKGKWSPNGYTITQNWLKEGLKPRCITRDLKWGTPVPLEEMKEKVFYVWFDAPIGYLSITATYTKQWEKWWKNPEQVQLYQFMGKDNVPFHTVIFPSSLIGTRDPYTLLHHVSTTEYLNYESGKFSKSRGVGVFGNNVVETGVPASVWRFYLLAIRPETNDSMFSWSDFALKVNTDLLANLGNFVNRTLKFLKGKYRGEVPTYNFTSVENDLIEKIDSILLEYSQSLENVKIREGLRLVLELSRLGNQYLTDSKLDNTLFETQREKCSTLMAFCVNIIYHLATLIHPYMPTTSDSILEQLHAPLRKLSEKFTMDILPGHCIGTPTHLFSKIEDKQVEELREKYKGKSDETTLDPAASKKPKNKKQADKKEENKEQNKEQNKQDRKSVV